MILQLGLFDDTPEIWIFAESGGFETQQASSLQPSSEGHLNSHG